VALKALQWARLKVEGGYRLRRGAWYAVGAIEGDNVLIRVRGDWVRVPWAALEVTGTEPSRWTVVPRPANVVMLPETWGPHYGVCPRCHYPASPGFCVHHVASDDWGTATYLANRLHALRSTIMVLDATTFPPL